MEISPHIAYAIMTIVGGLLMATENRGRFRSKGKIPRGPVVYRYKNKKTGKIPYVGETVNGRDRTQRHTAQRRPFADPKIYEKQWKPMDGRSTSRTRRVVERNQIKKHNPKYNQNAGGGGRIAGRRRSKR